MARDYKHAEVFSPGTRPLPFWMWLFAALAVAGFAGLIYYLDQYQKHKQLDPQGASVASTEKGQGGEAAGAGKGAASAAEASESRFDFYKLLPKLQVDVPKGEQSPARASSDADDKTPAAQPVFRYILQAGSFKDYHEADRLKAGLALMGIEATIEKVTLYQSQVWHRVRVGPVKSEREMNRLRNQLRAQDIEPVILKVKG